MLNFGHPGNNLPDHLNVLDLVLKMSPDFVVLQLYENDFETPDMMAHRPRDHRLMPLDMDERMMRSSVPYRLLIDRWNQFQEAAGLAEGYTRFMARHLRDPNSPDAREGFVLLEQFIERARAAGVPSGGGLIPGSLRPRSEGRELSVRLPERSNQDDLHRRADPVSGSSPCVFDDPRPTELVGQPF